jgi:L-aspartate oxidase
LLGGTVRANDQALTPPSNLEELTARIAEAERSGEKVTLDLEGLEIPPWAARLLAVARSGPARLTIAAHHGIGGIAIDSWGRTSLAGLYACGEAAGGVQGRRRTMGTGLLEAHIFGQRVAQVLPPDLERLGPASEASTVCRPPVPDRPAELDRTLDALLRPLVVERPQAEMVQALNTLATWTSTDCPADESTRAHLVGLRWQAARAMLECAVGRHRSQSSGAPTK